MMMSRRKKEKEKKNAAEEGKRSGQGEAERSATKSRAMPTTIFKTAAERKIVNAPPNKTSKRSSTTPTLHRSRKKRTKTWREQTEEE